jgi:hypothetical protein
LRVVGEGRASEPYVVMAGKAVQQDQALVHITVALNTGSTRRIKNGTLRL